MKGIERFKAAMLVILVITSLFAGILFMITTAKPVKANPGKLENFIPIDDGEVEEGRPNTNVNTAFPVEYYHYWIGYNAQDGDTIAGSDQGGCYLSTRVYLKWDLSGIAAATIENATLWCFNKYGVSNGDTPFNNNKTMVLDACKVASSTWSKNTITWNNAPTMGDVIDGNFLVGTAASNGIVNQWHSWDVTSWIQQQILLSNTTVSIGLKGHTETDDNSVWFYSKDAFVDQPRTYLSVQFTGPAVKVDIKPAHPKYLAGYPGGTLNYTVTVTNIGTVTDTYDLGKSDTAGWLGPLSLQTAVGPLNPNQSADVTLKVTIPSDAALGTEDTITVTATSEANPLAATSDTCTGLATDRILPTDDAYTHGAADRADNNFGGTALYAGAYQFIPKGGGTPGEFGAERTWMKFDLSAFSPNMTVGEVYLWLYYFGGTPPGIIGHIAVYGVGNDSWGEDTITWNNSPGGPGGALGAVIDGPKEVAEEGKWYYWDVTSFVQSQRTVDNIVSFVLIDMDENLQTNHSCGFNAKENENVYMRPYLEAPGYRMDVSISPQIQDNSPGGTLTYAVTVKNTGGFSDTYSLTPSDSAGWSPSLSSTSLTSVGANESRNVTLTVTIPSNAPVATRDSITVTATRTGVSASASCVAEAFLGSKLSPIADTFVSQGYTATNFGDNTSLYIQSAPSSVVSRNENIYLKFDLSGISAGSTISNAEIWLWCWSAKDADINAQIRKVTNDTWTESGLTWGGAIGLPGDLMSTTALKVGVTGWYYWDVTSFVQQQFAGDNTASFCIGAAVPDQNGTYIFYSKEWSDRTVRPQLRIATGAAPPENHQVSVSISPGSQSGSPGATLTYTVTVTNTGTLDDSYSLTKSDNSSWSLNLSSSTLSLAAGAHNTATLTVIIPSSAGSGASDTVTVTATSQADVTVSGNDTCVANVPAENEVTGVQVSISPASKSGKTGETLEFTVTVTNTGSSTDTFNLTASDTKSWGPTLSIASTTLAAGAQRTGIKLSITIPSTASANDVSTITVTATSQTNSTITGNKTCTATATGGGGGTSFLLYVGIAVVVIVIIAIVIIVLR